MVPLEAAEEGMSMKLVAVLFASLLATFVIASVPAVQAAKPGFVFPSICCYYNGVLVRTVVPPSAFPHEGRDNFYVVMSQAVFGIVAVAPGDVGYHGGQWAVWVGTWNVASYPLTSEAAVLAARGAGDLTLTRMPAADFLCPIQF
jgi:hypothetical protein